MKKFFRYFLAVVLGGIVSAITLFLLVLVLVSTMTPNDKKPYQIKSASVYHMKLDKPIVERAPVTIFGNISFMGQSTSEVMGLNDILASIKKAGDDANIKGIFLELSVFQAGLSTAGEIRQALGEFQQSGKFVVAYGDFMDKKSYYLATVANEVYVNPLAVVEFTGLKSEVLFYKGTFEKLGIEPKVFRVGNFKSFGERYDSKKLSPENREQINLYITQVWGIMTSDISQSRGITVQQLNSAANNLEIADPADLLKNKMVDGLLYRDQVLDSINKKTGSKDADKVKIISHGQMKRVEAKTGHRGFAKDKIAVIYAFGTVQMGSAGDGTISSEGISKAIREAREDSLVKAIVFRVNSGGGSALASEIIWRELKLAKEIKPVVVSMGDVAASGGYYISAPADTILATPFTLTGSIGVVGVTFNAKKLFNEKLGITHDVVKTNPHADFGSFLRDLEPVEEAAINKMLGLVYKTFVQHVAEGREMTYGQIDNIGQGHIWGGQEALKIGLVDKFGGVNSAIDIAARMAGTDKYRIVELPKQESPLTLLFGDAAKEARARLLVKELGPMSQYYLEIKGLINQGIYQARMPFDITIH